MCAGLLAGDPPPIGEPMGRAFIGLPKGPPPLAELIGEPPPICRFGGTPPIGPPPCIGDIPPPIGLIGGPLTIPGPRGPPIIIGGPPPPIPGAIPRIGWCIPGWDMCGFIMPCPPPIMWWLIG